MCPAVVFHGYRKVICANVTFSPLLFTNRSNFEPNSSGLNLFNVTSLFRTLNPYATGIKTFSDCLALIHHDSIFDARILIRLTKTD